MHEDVQKILARRSVREFTADPVNEATLRDLLKAAMSAPSAASADPWHFIVIRNPGLLARLAGAMPQPKALTQARVGIVVCGNLEAAHRRELSYLLQDCSAAVENLLLAASMVGLGACRLCIHPSPSRVREVRQVLHVPPTVIPVAAVALGFPQALPQPRTRFDEKKVHQEIW